MSCLVCLVCVSCFHLSKQWYGCQCLFFFLSCTEILIPAIAHGDHTSIVRESALIVDCGRKKILPQQEAKSASAACWTQHSANWATSPPAGWVFFSHCCQGGSLNVDFLATGRFVHTVLTDQILNTNIYGPWLLFITVVVVVAIVVDVYVFFYFLFYFYFYPYQFDKGRPQKVVG